MIKGRINQQDFDAIYISSSHVVMDRGWKPNVEISPTCPRCGSTNTKFCYYNNYSLTQPRYFCKGCRRYWTKGGSLRNVPVGGGCRKSRRGKPIRASVDGVASMGFASGVTALGSRCGTVLSNHNGTPMLTTSEGSIQEADGPNIDLALVYANFLNPKPPEPEPEPEPEPRLEIPELSNVVGPSFQFSSIETTMHMDLSTTAQLAQESFFLECRSLSDRSSDTHMSDGNPFYAGRTIDSYEKLQMGHDHHFTYHTNQINNCLLPPLPGEETVSHEGMVCPSSELMCPSNPVHATQSTGLLPQDSNQLHEHGSLFHNPNYGIFSGLDK